MGKLEIAAVPDEPKVATGNTVQPGGNPAYAGGYPEVNEDYTDFAGASAKTTSTFTGEQLLRLVDWGAGEKAVGRQLAGLSQQTGNWFSMMRGEGDDGGGSALGQSYFQSGLPLRTLRAGAGLFSTRS